MITRKLWTKERLIAEMSLFSTKSEFREKCNSAYVIASREHKGLIDSYFTNLRPSWDEQSVRAEALKYTSRQKFRESQNGAYQAAKTRYKWVMDEVYGISQEPWTRDGLIQEAAKYKTKKDFDNGSSGAYQVMLRKFPKLIDQLFENNYGPSDNDTIYIWRVVGCFYDGDPVYKIGVTSDRLGDKRIKEVAKKANMKFEIICRTVVKVKATTVEKMLHGIGVDPQYSGIDGYTEFRVLDQSALAAALAIVSEYT